ncbi:hypothetical protein [Marivita sp.]|jgi:hypothetical protein|uniref:hypothetical protein n=1 Tax=Marivita sp. TaxID=2003365 RepID=UPI002601C93E|nr:hypothetical protein [Marivita sp.]
MPNWIVDIYILLTTRVPIPRMLFLFSVITLSLFTLTAHHQAALKEIGLVLPVMCALFGHVAVVAVKMPDSLNTYDRIGIRNAGGKLILIWLAAYAVAIALPSMAAAQAAFTLSIAVYLCLFIVVFYFYEDGDKVGWFARDWTDGQRNAANWQVVRLVALILLNELAARHGTALDWIIAITLGPIALHYLMYWTILATHPYDKTSRPD